MSPGPRALGVRATSTVSFAVLALVLSLLLAVGTYLTARHFLVDQREAAAARQAFVDAALVREGLRTSGARVSDVLDRASPPSGAVVLVERAGRWYASSLDVEAEGLPGDVRSEVGRGRAALAWTRLDGGPALAVGVPVPSVGVEFYEVTPTTELDATLRTLGTVLAVFALATTAVGALIGRTASSRVVAPLGEVAEAAASIAAGRMATRLPETTDPDLAVIVGSFNTMVEALDERMRRDARFAADVAHELRSPVTTLMTSVSVLQSAVDGDAGRRREATALVEREVRRLHRSLEHLLALGRLEARVGDGPAEELDLAELVAHTLEDTLRPPGLLTLSSGAHRVLGRKPTLHRAVVNLLDNADVHGGGVTSVEVVGRDRVVEVRVLDGGVGVRPEDRERVFERFARVGSRGSGQGSGLGLSLVAEIAQGHGGSVRCEDAPGGGAAFVLALPVLRPATEVGA
ncbi:sensor histidine kinase [Phycicoccus avicenniae]|uniref:sensor histidine kinase n=1 Tax=Phycicoccus avicenniae TaxID=2828860 RepID=UPI003D292000